METQQHPPCGLDDPPLPFDLNTSITNPLSSETYRLLHPLGNGSYAIVYLVEESPSGYQYALKCLSKQNLTPDQLAIQTNEIYLHSRLPDHKNVVKLVTAFENQEWWFLVLEYVPGSDLYWWITQKCDLYHPTMGKRLNERERLELISNVFAQCLEAVRVVHSVGMSHRDLKPENFLITPSENEQGGVLVKLTDFGLSTMEKQSTDFDCGSKPYMSYECRNPLAPIYEPREADIWSLGIILLNLIWHRSPWFDPCPEECESFRYFMKDKISFLTRRFEGMPRHVAAFLATRVFGNVEDRIEPHEWLVWCRQLVDIMIDGVSTGVEVPTPPCSNPRKTFGFNISMTSLRTRSKELPAKDNNVKKVSSLFPLLSASVDKSSAKKSTSSIDFSVDDEEMDFTQPVVFDDGISVRVRSNDSAKSSAKSSLASTGLTSLSEPEPEPNLSEPEAALSEQDAEDGKERRRSDNDSGFATDEFRDSLEIPVSDSEDKPVTGIAKYIPPKLRFTKNPAPAANVRPEGMATTPPIPIPPHDHHRSRRHQATFRSKELFDDAVGSIPSSFGGHGINVGGFAYQKRPFAPDRPLYHPRYHPNNNGGPRKKSSREFTDRDRDGWRRSPVNRPAHLGGSPPKYSSPPSKYSTSPQSGKLTTELATLEPARKIRHRKRSSTASAADPVKLFNGPMPGMSNYQHTNRSMASLQLQQQQAMGRMTRPSIEKPTAFVFTTVPPTPTDDSGKNMPSTDDEPTKPDEEQDGNVPKVVPKNTMTEFGRLLKSIVGYNRSVKVGGEGKD